MIEDVRKKLRNKPILKYQGSSFEISDPDSLGVKNVLGNAQWKLKELLSGVRLHVIEGLMLMAPN